MNPICDCIEKVDAALAQQKQAYKIQGRPYRLKVHRKPDETRSQGRIQVSVVRFRDGHDEALMEHGMTASYCPFCGRKYDN